MHKKPWKPRPIVLMPPTHEYSESFVRKPLISCISKLKVNSIVFNGQFLTEDHFVEGLCENHELIGWQILDHVPADYYDSREEEEEDFSDRHLVALPEDVQMKLGYATQLNCGGRRILKHEPISLSLWPLVLERSKRAAFRDKPEWAADIIYYLIRGGIDLVFNHK